MLEKWKADMLFHQLFQRPDINKAYKMVPPTDSWYDTINCVHNSLAEIQKLPHEVWEITSHDGQKLQGIYYPCGSKKTMIWAHGYTSHAERESALPSLFYRSLGYNVLIPYQRAHDLSQGKYISFGALESRDMCTWVNKVNKAVIGGSIVLHGLSMGGGIVLFMSDKGMENVKCIVADAPSISIEDMLRFSAKEKFKKSGDKVGPLVMRRFQKEFGVSAADYNAFEIVKQSRYPMFLIAGSNEHMEDVLNKLKAACPKETQVVILPGCNHGNGMYKQTAMYQGALKDFLGKYVP